MPEGDTIHVQAALLRRAIGDREVTGFEAPRLTPPFPQPGEVVTGVEARGKHLLVRFSGGLIVHTHHRMTGSWRVYGLGQRWARSRTSARVVIACGDTTAVCHTSPVVEVLDEAAVRRHPELRRLGPDLCLPDADIDEAVRRWARMVAGDTQVGDALLHQGVSSGIGNVYRSEVLWVHRLHPTTPSRQVPEPLRAALLRTASEQLRANLTPGPRTTVSGGLAVYGRAGRACRRCGAAIEVAHLGGNARIAYWCPVCQPPPPADVATAAGEQES